MKFKGRKYSIYPFEHDGVVRHAIECHRVYKGWFRTKRISEGFLDIRGFRDHRTIIFIKKVKAYRIPEYSTTMTGATEIKDLLETILDAT